MFQIPVKESYPKVKLEGFEVSVPNSFICKSHSKVGKTKIPKITI